MSVHEERSRARLAALQALYQMEMTGVDRDDVVKEFVEHRAGLETEAGGIGVCDKEFFTSLVEGVVQNQSEIDNVVAQGLAEGWTLSRIDSILRALLRGAAYELIGRKDVPAKVVIDEYVELARDFFDGEEPKFVNAVLDRLARAKRAPEFGLSEPEGKLGF
jgi:N utilization substance protein B